VICQHVLRTSWRLKLLRFMSMEVITMTSYNTITSDCVVTNKVQSFVAFWTCYSYTYKPRFYSNCNIHKTNQSFQHHTKSNSNPNTAERLPSTDFSPPRHSSHSFSFSPFEGVLCLYPHRTLAVLARGIGIFAPVRADCPTPRISAFLLSLGRASICSAR